MPDPYTIYEAEALIAAIHRDWGEAQGNYDEFRFFTGLRPSEEIALELDDVDFARAIEVLKRHLALRARYQLEGKIGHENVFFRDNGDPIRNPNDPYDRWRWTLKHTLRARYREPYNARHSFVSWSLMIGKNVLWLAKQLAVSYTHLTLPTILRV